jgi:hypothetical protein
MSRSLCAAFVLTLAGLVFPPGVHGADEIPLVVLPGYTMSDGEIVAAVDKAAALDPKARPRVGFSRGSVKPFGIEVGNLKSEAAWDDVEKRIRAALAEYAGLPAEQLRQKVAETDGKLEEIRARSTMLKALADARAKLWPEILVDQVKSSELERQRLEMDLKAKSARAEAIRRQIAEVEERAAKKADSDPVTRLLEDTIALRRKHLELVRNQYKAGQAPRSDVDVAEIAVAEAEIQILNRRETVRQGAAGDLMDRLTSELVTLSIDLVEMQVRLDFIQKNAPPLDVNRLDKVTLDRLAQDYKPWYEAERSLKGKIDGVRDEEKTLLLEKFKLVVRAADNAPAPGRQ